MARASIIMSIIKNDNWLRESNDASIIKDAGHDGNALTIWHRQAEYDLISAVKEISDNSLPDVHWTGTLVGFSKWLDTHLMSIPHAHRDAMAVIADDIYELAKWFDSRCNASEYIFRCHRLDETMCPRFHTDRGPMRLFCTYRGKGTEWVPDTAVDYSLLKARGTKNSDIVPDPTMIQTVPNFAAAVLCGSDEHGKGGVVHRSPGVFESTNRFAFCMTLNF